MKQLSIFDDSVNELENQAHLKFGSGKYKEAISLYKKLLRESDNPKWREQLALCYLQRAFSFAEKEMYKEALALWDNYSQYTQPPYQAYDHYIAWLLQTKNLPKVQQSLGQLSAQQLDKDFQVLAVWLGLLIITEYPELQQVLPQDSAFIADLNAVQMALQAYRNNDPERVNEALRPLPYRSAFKDFRTLLKAAVLLQDSPEQAQSLLLKISVASPYSMTAKLLHACTCNGSKLAKELVHLDSRQRRIIGDIKGLNKQQQEFIEQLGKHKDRLSDKIKFNLALKYKTLCGSELAQRFCRALLTTYSAGRRGFNKNFGALGEFEEHRLKALIFERREQLEEAELHWEHCIRALPEDEADNALKIALILRHIAAKQPPPDNILSLERSLDYDPDDSDSYMEILHFYNGQSEDAAHFKKWLEKALKKFPDNIDVLILAIQSAIRNKSYKKTVQYAQQLLTVDPLNTFAKQVLFSSHLAHARQLIRNKKYPSVSREISQAENLKLSKKHILKAKLLRGYFIFAAEDKKLGLQQIAGLLEKLHTDPVNAMFQATMEALLMGLPVATILRVLPPVKGYLLSAQELEQLIEQIKSYSEEGSGQQIMRKTLEKVKSVLKQSLQQQGYTEDLILSWCQILDSIGHYELLRHASKLAQSRWQKPIWDYYRIYSGTFGDPGKCSNKDLMSLEYNQHQARQEGDQRALVLISNYLDRYYEQYPRAGFGFLDEIFDPYDDGNSDDPFDELFGHLPDDLLNRLENKMASLLKKTTPEKLVKALIEVVGDRNKLMLAIMQDPDLFTALMMLYAADKLGIDIDVSIDDVFQCFDVYKQSRSLPF